MRTHKVRALIWQCMCDMSMYLRVIKEFPAARTLRTLTCCTTHLHCADWMCHCHATHHCGVCAAPFAQNSSDLATLQKFAKGVPNLNAALRSRNLTAWEDGGKFCTWEGVTCAVNTTRVSSLTLPSVELEGALALIGRDWPSAPAGPTPHQRAFALGPKRWPFMLVMWCGMPCHTSQEVRRYPGRPAAGSLAGVYKLEAEIGPLFQRAEKGFEGIAACQ